MRIKYCLGLHVELAKSKKREKPKIEILYRHKMKLGVSSLMFRIKQGGKICYKQPPFFLFKHAG